MWNFKPLLYLLLLTNLLLAQSAKAQVIGVPFIDSYAKEVYGFGTQNWDIDQSANGLLYFANNDGLLEFDGSSWALFPLPNKTILRTILMDGEQIYAGGQNEFGVYIADQQSKWTFISLKKFIPEEHQDFEDVWNLVKIGDQIAFRSSEKLFLYQDSAFTVLDEIPIHFLGEIAETLYVQHKNGLLYQVEGTRLRMLPDSELLRGTEVSSIIRQAQEVLISTHKKGLFVFEERKSIQHWEHPKDPRIDRPFTNTLNVLPNGDLVIGTGFKGLIVVGPNRRFKYRLTTKDGLSNNNVISTFVDKDKNLWLGLDSGISMIQTNSPFSKIYPDGQTESAGYDVKIFKNQIYFGTSDGLFSTNWDTLSASTDFSFVAGTNGQVWGIDEVNERLILSHKDGAFFVEQSEAKPFFEEDGVWLFKEDESRSDLIVSGSYKGIYVFDKATFQPQFKIANLNESCRFIVQDRNRAYWMSHPYRGVFKIEHPQNPGEGRVRKMGAGEGLPSDLHNHIFKINNEILLCAETGTYSFDEDKQQFIPYEPINNYLGKDVKVRRLVEAPNGNIWFITEKEIGYLEIRERGLDRTITKKVFPFLLKQLNGGWEKIYPYDDEHVFIPTIKGFLHFNTQFDDEDNTPFQITLKEVIVDKDSTIFPLKKESPINFAHYQRSFLFKVAALEYVNNESVQFQYYLKGLDEDWSPLTKLRVKEYTNLSPNSYELQIRAVNQKGEYSPIYKWPFKVQTPWYSSKLALLFYLALFILLGYSLYARIRKGYQKLEQKVDSTVKQSNEKIQQLETEKIQAELDHKKRELVSVTINLVKKNETINELADQLLAVKKKTREEETSKTLGKLIHFLKRDAVAEDRWEQIMYHFNELNKGFFDRLKKAYPAITPKDLKLCAYLKMNLTTKEIASLMSISIRGVEASRYRLRKKINLDSNKNLTEFLMGL